MHSPASLTTREAFARALELRPEAGTAWLEHLATVAEGELLAALDRLPPIIASDSARAFAKAVVASNRAHLLALPRS